MKLCFTIDALSAAGDDAWRLLEDGESWRPSVFAEDLRKGDAMLEGPEQVKSWAGLRLRKDKERLLAPKGKPGMFDFLMRGIFAHAIPHRLSPAPIPEQTQMIEAVRQAKPGTPWLAYLDLAGHFRMLDSSRERIIGNPNIAVRGEIASASDYTGPEAADQDIAMETLYRQFLAGWLEHLETRRLAIFIPDAEKLPAEADLTRKIGDWQHE
ncbi:MAG TPA: hypothetical protein VJ961_03335 [Mariprofundaceae bacterium]|nr:hypothetical protein [Mariprofundaceae bacterium]